MTRTPLFFLDPSQGYRVPEKPGDHFYVVPQDSTGCAVCGGDPIGHLGQPAVPNGEPSSVEKAFLDDMAD